MYFTITSVICPLIFSVNLFLEIKLVNGQQAANSTQGISNPTTKLESATEKSNQTELSNLKEQYVVKNTIEDFETHWARFFQPDLSKVDKQSPPARQAVQIRFQRWVYIFNNLENSHIVKRLDSELDKAKIDRTTFCTDIAEAYFELSCNGSLFHNSPSANNPLLKKSVQTFMDSVSYLKLNPDQPDETVQIPKSLYVDLLFRDANGELLKNHHRDQMSRLKDAYRKRVRQARLSSVYDVGSELSTEFD